MTDAPHDTNAAAPAALATEEELSFAELLAQQGDDENTGIRLHPGQRVNVRIVAITGDTVFVSTGAKVDGVVDRAELEKDGELPYAVGDSLDLYVVVANAQEVKLSRVMNGDGSLAALEEARESNLPVEGRVTAQVKGGYSVDIMKRRAFCPMSQMDIRPLADPESVIGQVYPFLITKLENHGRNIVVSRRDLLEREQAENLEKLLADVKEGDIREGVVSRLAPFGAFIELAPGVEGLAHVTELSWSRVERPEDALSVGETVRFKILEITPGPKGTRISLSLKAATEDPWNTVVKEFKEGDTVTGKVTRLSSFGAFVELAPGVEGLVHLSELSFERRIMKAEEVVNPGDVVSVKIKEVEPQRRRISLSLRDTAGNPWDRVDELISVGTDMLGTVEKRAPFGLFISLAPGITGLLPNQVIKNSPKRKALDSLNAGDAVTVRVNAVDPAARRVSLLPEGEEGDADMGEKNWRQHAPKAAPAPAMGALGLALQQAQAKKSRQK